MAKEKRNNHKAEKALKMGILAVLAMVLFVATMYDSQLYEIQLYDSQLSYGVVVGQAGKTGTGSTCSDTDGGQVFTVAGTATAGKTSSDDVCLDSTRLEEFYCDKNKVESIIHDCAIENMICRNNACVYPVCGNGLLEPGEECEGLDFGGKTCASFERAAGRLVCKSNCKIDSTHCPAIPSTCRNGVLDFGEQCEGTSTKPCVALNGNLSRGSFTGETATCNGCFYDTSACIGPTGGSDIDGLLQVGEQCAGGFWEVGNVNCATFGFDSGSVKCETYTDTYDTKSCCFESDGGYNIYMKGTGRSSFRNFTEYCLNSDTGYPGLMEYNCSSSIAVGQVATSYSQGGCTYGCFNGRCLNTSYHINCTDPDGPTSWSSRDRYVKSTTRIIILETGEITEEQDRCKSDSTGVIEYYCNPMGFITYVVRDCSAGCEDGACKVPSCGDGIITDLEVGVMEECDGAELGEATCELLGFDGGILSCRSDCRLDISECYACGDGRISGNEICDGIDFGGLDCTSLGFTGGTLACTNDCKYDTSRCISDNCIGEGGSIPVIASPPSCCPGLTLIPPKDQYIVGSAGICTAKCGNGVCDTATESDYNCPADCKTQAECTDSDGGMDFYVKGTTSGVLGGTNCLGDLHACPGDTVSAVDVCNVYNVNNVDEYYCSDNKVMGMGMTCPYGCRDGACMDAPTPPLAYCGDGIVQYPEQCDDDGLIGSCTQFGNFTYGDVTCNPETCTFDLTWCY